MKVRNIKIDTVVAVAILSAVAALVCALSLYILWYGDALIYQFNYATDTRLQSITEIPLSQYSHFFRANGRIIAHLFVQFFCGFAGQAAFAICNAIVSVCLVILLIKYSGGNWRDWPTTLAASLVTLFFCDISYIPSHQICYVWMACTALAFLIIYQRQGDSATPMLGKCVRWSKVLVFITFGLICGNGNEAIDLGIAVALFIDMLRQRRRYGLIRLMLLIGFSIGVGLLCISPGIIRRAHSSSHLPLVMSVYNFVVSLRAFWVFALLLTVACLRRKVSLRVFFADNWLLLTAMGVMIVFNLVITVKSNRQLFGIELYSAVMTLRLLRHFRISVVACCGVAVVACQYYMKFSTITVSNRYEAELRRHMSINGNKPMFIDMLDYNPYVNPAEEMSFRDNKYISMHLISIASDINGGDSSSRLGDPDCLSFDSVYIYPTTLAEIENLQPRNRVVYCGNDVYMLLRLKSRPAKFMLHRSLGILGLKWPLSSCEIPVETFNYPPTDQYDVCIYSLTLPLIHVDSVTIEQKWLN